MCIGAKRGQASPCPTVSAPALGDSFSSELNIPSQIDDDWRRSLQFDLSLMVITGEWEGQEQLLIRS